jgi:DNA-binding transcriptional LysR family regulator
MERLRGDLREYARGGVRGHIRLMSNTTALEEYLPDVLAGWLATNPGVDIALEDRLSHEITPAIAQAHADIGVLTDLAGAEGLETYPFRIDRLVIVVPRSHVLAGRRKIAFVDVLDEEFVGLAAGSTLAEHLAWQSARLGRSLKLWIWLRGLDAVLPHGGVWCGDRRRTGNGRSALSANHGARHATAHRFMGYAANNCLCTPLGRPAGTCSPIG